MHIQSDSALLRLPKDILTHIIQFAINNRIDTVVSLTLVNKLLKETVQLAAQNSLNEYWAEPLRSVLIKRKRSVTCAFFALTTQEAKRLKFHESKELCEFDTFKSLPTVLSLDSPLMSLRKKLPIWSEEKEKELKLSSLLINMGSISLSEKLENFLMEAVNARAYEMLGAMYTSIIKNYKNINSQCIVDFIYRQACYNYNELEFIQLLAQIPMDLNRQIINPVLGIGANSYAYKCPLLHVAIEALNVELVKYLIEKGADINEKSSQNKSALDVLYDMRKYKVAAMEEINSYIKHININSQYTKSM